MLSHSLCPGSPWQLEDMCMSAVCISLAFPGSGQFSYFSMSDVGVIIVAIIIVVVVIIM